MKNIINIILVAIMMISFSSCNKGEVDFKYTPEEPRCGQSINFSNISTKGDSDSKWKWEFGDGSTATTKSATKIYRQAGIYMVTLTLNEKKLQRAAKEITIYDSVPSFTSSTEIIGTYEEVTFTPLTYNPFSLTITYEWTVPENTVVLSDESSPKLRLYFTEPSENAEITLKTTVGSVESIKTISYKVYETPAPSIIMSTDKGELLLLKKYNEVIANPENITPRNLTLTNPRQLLIDGNTLYIFDLCSGAEGAIYAMNLDTQEWETVIENASSVTDYVYSTGMVHNGYLYFVDIDNKNIYRVSTDTRNATFTDGKDQLFASASNLTGMQTGVCGGLGIYNDIFYLGSTAGVYRFKESDINSGSPPATALLSTEDAPLNLKIDALAGKIYSIEDKRLTVTNIDGSSSVTLDDEIESSWALCISNKLNRVVYAKESSVLSLPLVQTRNNTTTATPMELDKIQVIGVVVDETDR